VVTDAQAVLTSEQAVVTYAQTLVTSRQAVVTSTQAEVRNDEAVVTYASYVVSNVKATVKFDGAIAMTAIVTQTDTCRLSHLMGKEKRASVRKRYTYQVLTDSA